MSECTCVVWRKAVLHTRFYVKAFRLIITSEKKRPSFRSQQICGKYEHCELWNTFVIEDTIEIKY